MLFRSDEIEIGDRFLYKGKEYTVTSMQGIHPDEVGVSYTEKDTLHMIEYDVTSNFDKYILAEQDYLGNDLRNERDTEKTKTAYEPKIGDVVEWFSTNYRISDVSSDIITLMQEGTFIPEVINVPYDIFINGKFSVIEEVETVSEFAFENTDVSENKHSPDNNVSKKSASGKNNKAADSIDLHDYKITDEHYGESGGAKSRYSDNIAAIKTLKAIESENRKATPDEQQILSKFTGWGAIPQAFDSTSEKWSKEYEELKSLLTDDEYSAARKSTMNAHYTSPTVINAVYAGLEKLGFKGEGVIQCRRHRHRYRYENKRFAFEQLSYSREYTLGQQPS